MSVIHDPVTTTGVDQQQQIGQTSAAQFVGTNVTLARSAPAMKTRDFESEVRAECERLMKEYQILHVHSCSRTPCSLRTETVIKSLNEKRRNISEKRTSLIQKKTTGFLSTAENIRVAGKTSVRKGKRRTGLSKDTAESIERLSTTRN